ncbi:hypothetical protein PsorP6_006015 [Peronosclerospora sorghi]|uniref:Uncharacterized protein n=1 Tax=Peronosclerospora sorghi TaxID=230839 RepID=A0ACC0W2V6_9STRA|nr:hypothetical protein PsorP6_006015 [Peronosclerospora sorghi]
MTSIFSAGQSITSIGKSMTAIARVEEHLATFMKKVRVIMYNHLRLAKERTLLFYLLLLTGVVDTATLLFQRCYEYRDEIRDELESSVAYVADAGRWVVGLGDWNSKMEKRLSQISELVVLANTLLAEYAVTGEIGSKGSGDDLLAYLQILAATVTLKNPSTNGKSGKTLLLPSPIVQAQPTTVAEFNSEMVALGSEIKGALSGMFGSKDPGESASLQTVDMKSRPQGSDSDDEAMNPFAASYLHPVGPCNKSASSVGASVTRDVQSVPNGSSADANAIPQQSIPGGDSWKGTASSVSIEEYECLDMDSIPKYAAFKSSTQRAARRQLKSSPGYNSFATSTSYHAERGANSTSSTNCNELSPFPAPTVSRNVSSLDTSKKKPPVEPMMDINYSYDLQCEVAHNPFLSPIVPGSIVSPPEADKSLLLSDTDSVHGAECAANATVDRSVNQDVPLMAATRVAHDDDDNEFDLFGVGKV